MYGKTRKDLIAMYDAEDFKFLDLLHFEPYLGSQLPLRFCVDTNPFWDAISHAGRKIDAYLEAGGSEGANVHAVGGKLALILRTKLAIKGQFYAGFTDGIHRESVERYGVIIREKGNRHDSYAIRVYAVVKELTEASDQYYYRAIGFVAAEQAAKIAPVLDAVALPMLRVLFDDSFNSLIVKKDITS